MPDSIRRLLDFIVTNYVVVDEQKDIDLNAAASESGGEIESEKADTLAREKSRADEQAAAFEAGLRAAGYARSEGQTEISLDDRDADQNAMADALIRYLVSFGLATSRSEETEPLHYVYHVAVDWNLLGEVATAAKVDLASALGGARSR